MLESNLEQLIRTELLAGLTARGMTDVIVKRNNQPQQAAVPTEPTVFFSFVSKKNWGFPARKDVWNQAQNRFDTYSTQVKHSRYQIAGLANNLSAITSSDLSSIASDIIQSEAAIAHFIEQDCNIFRIIDLPAVWFQDDKAQNSLWASFDVIFTHKESYLSPTPVAARITGNTQVIN